MFTQGPAPDPKSINVCGSLNCSFIMAYAMLSTFISSFTFLVLWLSGKTTDFRKDWID